MARRKGRSLTRQDVVQAAIRCIDAEGESALGVNRVARELGIKPPSLYNHVNGNEDLRKAVAVEGWRILLSLVEPIEKPEETGGLLRKMILRYYEFARERPALSIVLASTAIPIIDTEYFDVQVGLIVEHRRALVDFNLSPKAETAAGNYIRATYQGYIALEQTKIIQAKHGSVMFNWMVDRLIESLKNSDIPDTSLPDDLPTFTHPEGGYDDIPAARADIARQLEQFAR